MAYMIKRGALYYLALKLPKHLLPRCHTLRLSLNIRQRQSALFLAASLAQQVHSHLNAQPIADLQTLRRLCSEWRDATPTKPIQTAPKKVPAATMTRNLKHPTMSPDQIAKLADCGVATVYRIKKEAKVA